MHTEFSESWVGTVGNSGDLKSYNSQVAELVDANIVEM